MPQLERAKEIANHQDLSTSNGTSFIKKLNFLELRDDEIEERVKNDGVSLGESSNQIKNSITSIKELEKHRSLVFLSKNLLDVDDSSSFVLRNASNLSVDLIDDGERLQEDQEDLLIPIINLKKR
jgi:hypothetical protein